MMLLAFCSVASFALAQEETESYPTLKHKVVTNGFWDNWFIDVAGTHLSSYSSQEHNQDPANKNPFWPGRRNWGGELSIGKWATPVFGMRLKGVAAWDTQVNFASWDNPDYVGGANPTLHQVTLSFQPMINLTNLIGGYKPRVWNISVYGGAGAHLALKTKDVNKGGAGVIADYNDVKGSLLVTAGVLNTFNITKRLHAFLDVYGNMGENDMDRVASPKTGNRFKTRDLQLGIAAGIGVNLGKTGWDNAPDMDAILANHQAQLDALNASIAALEAENAALKKCCEEKPKVIEKEVVKTVSEFQATSASVFFNINKSEIASKKDLVNVKELAEAAKANNKKVVVTGYADSKTGSPAYNQTLSEKRAEAVKKALVDMGVSADNIETAGQGGVADLTPIEYNRRAVVTLK